MHQNLLRLIFLIMLVLILNGFMQLGSHVGNNTAFACECVQPKPANEALNESRAVFSGKVTDMQPENYNRMVTFDVDRAWKGISNTTIIAVTGSDSGSCGFPFEKGEVYLVYTYGAEEPSYTSSCSRTKPLSEAQEDLKVLGIGYVPIQNTGNSDSTQGVNGSFPFIASIGVVLAGIIVYLTFRKYKK